MADDDEAQLQTSARMSTFGRFHDVARRHLGLMQETLASIPPEPPHPWAEEGPERIAWDVWEHGASGIRERADEHATIAIIFSCAACELYINDAAARLLGDKYSESHIDNLDLVSKWMIVPRLAFGHTIDRSGRAYNLLRLLVRARNDLMHPKSKPFSWEKFDEEAKKAAGKNPPKTRIDFAPEAIEALDRLGEEAEKFDLQGQGAGLYDHEEHVRRMWERAK